MLAAKYFDCNLSTIVGDSYARTLLRSFTCTFLSHQARRGLGKSLCGSEGVREVATHEIVWAYVHAVETNPTTNMTHSQADHGGISCQVIMILDEGTIDSNDACQIIHDLIA